MPNITYSALLAPENDLFKTEISTAGFPLKIYRTQNPRYSTVELVNSQLNQLDIRVTIFDIVNTSTATKVVCNSANLLASDVKFDDEYYYFRHKRDTSFNFLFVDGVEYTAYDANFIYFKEAGTYEIVYKTGQTTTLTVSAEPKPVFLNRDYKHLSTLYNLDNRYFKVGKLKDNLEVVFNKPDVRVIAVEANIFSTYVEGDSNYPTIFYHPFRTRVIDSEAATYLYDFADVEPTIVDFEGETQYFYKTHFYLFDFERTGVIDFPEDKYETYDCFVGFDTTKAYFAVFIDGSFIYLPEEDTLEDLDTDVVFPYTCIKKNRIEVDIFRDNFKNAVIVDKELVKDGIQTITADIQKGLLPSFFYLSDNRKDFTFQNIPGQEIKDLNSFLYIEGFKVSDSIFKFDISSLTPFIDTETGELDTDLIFDYTASSDIKDYLEAWKPFTEAKFDYTLDIEDFYLYMSEDGIEFTKIEQSNYDMSINSTVTELTINLDNIDISEYNHVAIGIATSKYNLISPCLIDLGDL